MKLHRPEFEKRIKRRVRQEVRKSATLRRKQRERSAARRFSLTILLRPLFSLLLALAAYQVAAEVANADAALVLVTLWAMIFVFHFAGKIGETLYRSPDLAVFGLLPIAEQVVLRWQLQKFFRGSFWFLLDCFGLFVGLGMHWGLSLPGMAACAVLATVLWLSTVALGSLCLAYLPQVPWGLLGYLGFAAVVVLALVREAVASHLLALANTSGSVLNLVLPTGWTVSLLHLLLPEPARPAWLALIAPVAAILAAWPLALVRIKSSYVFEETVVPEAADILPEEVQPTAPVAGATRPTARVGESVISEIVSTRTFLALPTSFAAGWLDRLFWRVLRPRERLVAEIAFPEGLNLTRPWVRQVRNAAVCCAAVLLLERLLPAHGWWLLGPAGAILSIQAFSRFVSSGRIFEPLPSGGVVIPRYACWPVGFRDFSGLLLKLAAVQWPLFLGVATALGFAAAVVLVRPPWVGVVAGTKAALLLLAGRVGAIPFEVSAMTNDTARVSLRSMALVLSMLCLGAGFVGLAAGSFLLTEPLDRWLCVAGAFIVAAVWFGIYRWFYHHTRFDLLSKPK